MTPSKPNLLTTAQLAEALHVCPATVLAQSDLPRVKVSARRWVYNIDEVLQHMKAKSIRLEASK